MNPTTIAVDLAKDVFEVAVANRANRIVARHRLSRAQFERFLRDVPPGTEVVMEACGTAQVLGTGLPRCAPQADVVAGAVCPGVRAAQ